MRKNSVNTLSTTLLYINSVIIKQFNVKKITFRYFELQKIVNFCEYLTFKEISGLP